MDASTIKRIHIRCLNAAFRLQHECYEKQSRKGKIALKRFTPCAKGLVFTRELQRETPRVLSEIETEVCETFCDCHSSFSINDAIEYSCDVRFNPYASSAS